MKALSMWQPWGTLWVLGPKDDETRSWAPPAAFRGPLAVHASKRKPTKDEYATLNRYVAEAARRMIADRIPWPEVVPLGYVIGVIETIDVWRATSIRREGDTGDLFAPAAVRDTRGVWRELTAANWNCGDLSPGRYGWRRGIVRPLPTPVPCRGMQGLFTLPDDVERAVLAQLPSGCGVAGHTRADIVSRPYIAGVASVMHCGACGREGAKR